MRPETFQSEDLELFVDFAIKQNEVWTEMALTIAFQIPMQGVIAIILFQRVKRNVFCESFDNVDQLFFQDKAILSMALAFHILLECL